MLAILSIIAVRVAFSIHQPKSRRRCFELVGITACYVIADAAFIACDLSEKVGATVFGKAVFFFYLVYVLLPFVWHLFVRNFVGLSFKSRWWNLEYVPLAILLGLVVCTPFTGALWTITPEKVYIRGPLFHIYSILNYFYYIESLSDACIIWLKHQWKKEPYFLWALAISLIPLAAAFINNFTIPVYQIYPFQPFCSLIVTLLSYFFMASKENDRLQEQRNEVLQKALDEAQEASRVKTTFLSNISHDIRTPMNAIINLAKLAREENDITVAKEYLEKMQASSDFLLGLINDVLDMSRIESGELQLHPEPFSRRDFLNTLETVIRPLMDSKHINFHSEYRLEGYTIFVDKLRFNQIFFNLLSNAMKFTPEGGDVWFHIYYDKPNENDILHCRFVVRDNGIGMTEEFQKHLFEPFARERTKEVQGSGLGLAIVKSLVSAMGGTITAKSKKGEGSEFDVVLDVKVLEPDKQENKDQQDSSLESLKGFRILLVEDNELNTYVAQTLLDKVGCVVTTAKNGQEAVDLFNGSKPGSFDAILMDVRMPVMDGIEATKTIRALEKDDAKTVPIIATTADAFAEERKRTLDAGMNYHLSKPIDSQQLYKVLGECARNKN